MGFRGKFLEFRAAKPDFRDEVFENGKTSLHYG